MEVSFYRGRASKTECQIVISTIWISSIILSFPMGFAMEVIFRKDDNGGSYPFCFPERLGLETMQIYRTVMVLMQYVMPLSVILWAYSSISFALWGNTAPGNAQTDRDANLMRNKKRVSNSIIFFTKSASMWEKFKDACKWNLFLS